MMDIFTVIFQGFHGFHGGFGPIFHPLPGHAAAAPGAALAGARGARLPGERPAALQAAEGGPWDLGEMGDVGPGMGWETP